MTARVRALATRARRIRTCARTRTIAPVAALALLSLVPTAQADSWSDSGSQSLGSDPARVIVDEHSTTPYAMVDLGSSSAGLYRWTGSAWTTNTGSGTVPGFTSYVDDLLGDPSTPVIGRWDYTVSQWKVARYSGGSWVDLGPLPSMTNSQADEDRFALGGTVTNPVVIRAAYNSPNYSVRIDRWDGSTWVSWTRYSGGSIIDSVDVWANGSTILATWSQAGAVMVDEWSASTWTSRGTPGTGSAGARPAIVSWNGSPWVAYHANDGLHVASSASGTTWVERLAATEYALGGSPELTVMGGRPVLAAHTAYTVGLYNNQELTVHQGLTHNPVLEWWGSGFVPVGGDAYGGQEEIIADGRIGGLTQWQGRPAVVRTVGPGSPALTLRQSTRGAPTNISSRLVTSLSSSTNWTFTPGCGGDITFMAGAELRGDVDVADWNPGYCNDPDGSASYVKSPADPASSVLRNDFKGLPVNVSYATNVRARVRVREEIADADSVDVTINLRSSDGTLLATATQPVTAEQVHETAPVGASASELRNAYVEVVASETGGSVAGTKIAVDSVNIDFDADPDWTARLRPNGFPNGTGYSVMDDGIGTCELVQPTYIGIVEDVEVGATSTCVAGTPSNDGKVRVDDLLDVAFTTTSIGSSRVVRASLGLSYALDVSVNPANIAVLDAAPPYPATCTLGLSEPNAWCDTGRALDWGQADVDGVGGSLWWDVAGTEYIHMKAIGVDVLVAGAGAGPPPLTPPTSVADAPSGADLDGQASTTTLSANWPAVSHADFASYDRCFTTSSTGADCATTAVAAWQNTTSTSSSAGSLSLASGTTYYACVRSVHVDATTTSPTCSDGITVDSVPPGVPTLVSPTDAATLAAAPTLSATYVDADTSGRVEFQACPTSTCTTVSATGSSSVVASGANGTFAPTITSGTWYWRARNVDASGLQSAWSAAWSFTYNQAPTATALSPNPGAWVTTTQPALQVRHDDGDGGVGTVRVETCLTNAADPWSTNCGASYQVVSTPAGAIASGDVASLSPNTPLPQGSSYWRARTSDSTGTTSAWTTPRQVRVDSIAPSPTPTVTFQRSGLGKIVVNWNTATDTGIGGVRWDVEAWNDTLAAWEPLCMNTTSLSCTKSGLGGDQLLIARVRACDGLGNCTSWVANGGGVNSGYLLRSLASSNLGNAQSRKAQLAPGGTLDTTSTGVTLPSGNGANRTGQFPFRYNTDVSAKVTLDMSAPIDPQAVPSGWGWVIDDVEGLSLPAGGLGATVVTEPTAGTSGNGVGTILCRVWKAQTNGSTSLVSWTHLGDDTGDVADVMTAAGSGRTTSTCELPSAFATQTNFAADEVLYVEFVLDTPAGGGSNGDGYKLVFNGTAGSTIDIPRPGSPPNAPMLVSPTDAARVPVTPTLVATYDHPTPRSGVLEFEVATDAGFTTVVQRTTSTLVVDDANASVAVTGLAPGTQYWWRVRGQDASSLVGPWSSPVRSFTTNSPPATPTLASPADGASLASGAITFSASAFSDVDTPAGDSHGASQWQVIPTGGSWASPLHDSGVASAATSWSGPTLTVGSYQWRTRYRDSFGAWSSWSTARSVSVTGGSVSIGVDAANLSMGVVAKDSDRFVSTRVTVVSTAPTGYQLTATDASDTVGWSCSCASTIADWTGTDADPTAWAAGSGGYAGITVRDASGGRLSKWGAGTETAENDTEANLYAGLRNSTSTTLHARGGPTTGDHLVVTWRLNIPGAASEGSYSTTTTLTAVANP